jgi:Cof subfamily protein (haloacid dehalogenase superfamily)
MSFSKKKVIIFDIDGTAVDSPDQKIPTKALISEMSRLSKKYYLCAATGRSWSFALPVLKVLNLSDPCIISAGTQICNPKTGEILWQKIIDNESLDEVLSIFRMYPSWKLLYNDMTEDDYFNGGILPPDFKVKQPVYFLEQAFIPDPKAQEIHKNLAEVKGVAAVMVVAQKPGCRDIHVIASDATKEHSISKLLEIIGLSKKDTIGIGDGYNDIHLFNAVNFRVAMGNAVPELKQAADLVIDSVKDDGLARFLATLQ